MIEGTASTADADRIRLAAKTAQMHGEENDFS
jgi:hypothetical protein